MSLLGSYDLIPIETPDVFPPNGPAAVADHLDGLSADELKTAVRTLVGVLMVRDEPRQRAQVMRVRGTAPCEREQRDMADETRELYLLVGVYSGGTSETARRIAENGQRAYRGESS